MPARPPGARPEILAPAGDDESLTAALKAGADAVYFGLAEGFNARARAENFTLAALPETVRRIHRHGARAYVTLNTLVFDSELPAVARILERVAGAGVDAILVQDPAVALLARELAPGLEVHASTQMTLSSAEGMALAKELGLTRVVLPRELSLEEIQRLRAGTDIELEVFVHGALCMSWSGQCLTSEAWGGRSANRGQCAQSCRLPYDLLVDGVEHPLGEVAYLLSPRDLAAWPHVPRLIDLGIASLKIEGRQKGPQYVMTAVEAYRKAVDRALAKAPRLLEPAEESALQVSFSRGFSSGFFDGVDHQRLVDGRFPKHRGLFLGTVESVAAGDVLVRLDPAAVAPSPGDGVVFDAGRPDTDEAGGPIFGVTPADRGACRLRFGRPGPDLSRVRPGQRVWKTSDAALARRVQQELRAPLEAPARPLALVVSGRAGAPLRLTATGNGHIVTAESDSVLAPAVGAGLDAALLEAKLGRLGGTGWRLESLDGSGLDAGLHLPVSELNGLRRSIVAELERRAVAVAEAVPPRIRAAGLDADDIVGRLLERLPGAPGASEPGAPVLRPLCRTDAQLDAVLELGFPEVELDWMEMVGLETAVARARAAGLRVTIATVRVQKPGEEGYDRRIARLEPDGLLVRHWGALEWFRRGGAGTAHRPVLHGDFSLNAANAVTARFLLERGLSDLTPAHDLDAAQLGTMLSRVDPARVVVVLHHHIATFHTEHCVYAHLLSEGRDFRTCGRPCEERAVALRDRTGDEHPVVVDVGCRNTVFNARAQSAAAHVPDLLARGVRTFRVEFVRETREEARVVLEAGRDLLAGRIAPGEAAKRAGAVERFGVTSGTLRVLA
jgi:putative protease